VHDCFTRRLRPGVRPVDPDPNTIVSPCDAIIGASGPIKGQQVFQAKGYPYDLSELFGSANVTGKYQDGEFVTLRLRSSMYHRFMHPTTDVFRR